jgi:DNA-binding NarL/FixJ family response regulator
MRTVVVEDHAATRTQLCELLVTSPTIDLVGVYAHAEDLLASTSLGEIDVVLVDLHLPGMNGIDAIRELSERAAQVRCVALTVASDDATVLAALRAGAFGYLLKGEPPQRIVAAIEEASSGEHPVSGRVLSFLYQRARANAHDAELSPRERQVALELARGLTHGECAQAMTIGVGTVQGHVKSLYLKLRVRSRKELRDWLSRNGEHW